MPPRNTASLNIRLSKEARDENLSVEGMEADCRQLAERYGVTVVAVHVDEQSGAIRNRPGFVAWLNDAREGRVDHLIAWHVDRMTREGVNVAAAILDVVEGKDPETGRVIRPSVRLLDTKGLDSFGDQTAFRFQFVIAAEVARAERERMRDRARVARRRAHAAGRWAGGPPPFGFRAVPNPDGPGKVLAIEPAEAAAVVEAAARVLAGGPLIKVVRWMNSPAGHKPRRAREWQQTTLRQTLMGGPIGGRLGDEGACPAIVTPDQAAALRSALAVRTPAQRGGRIHSRLLSGLLRCHACDSVLQVAGRSQGLNAYRCPNPRQSGTCNAPVSVSCKAIEGYIAERFLNEWGGRPEYVRHAQITGAAAVETAELAKADALVTLGASPTPENFQRLQDAQAALDEALQIPQEAVVLLKPSGRTIGQAWAESDVHGRRDLIAANYAAIIIKPGKRGAPGIQPERVALIEQPPHTLATEPETFRWGAAVVEE